MYVHNNPVLRVDPYGLCDPWPKCANDFWDNVAVSGHQRGGLFGTLTAAVATGASSLIEFASINQADRGLDMVAEGRVAAGVGLVAVAIMSNFPAGRAVGKVDEAVDAALGGVQANRVAGQVGEAFLERTYGGTNQVSRSTTGGVRVIDNLADGVARESKVGRTSLTATVRSQITKDVLLLRDTRSGITRVEWHFFPSRTGAGPTAPLKQALENAGIPIVIHR